MPLHDHFVEPMASRWPWATVHSHWITFLCDALNQQLLPSGYHALSSVHLGGLAQIDVSAFAEQNGLVAGNRNGVATVATWAPPQPPLVASMDFADADLFEVEVYAQTGGHRLVAAIELVSPANKDRPGHRRGFAAKCAALLRENISLIVVDIITERHANLHAELMDLCQLNLPTDGVAQEGIYAIAYRGVKTDTGMQLEAWPGRVALGEALPLLPLWLAVDLAIPLDLEQSYRRACDSLRLP